MKAAAPDPDEARLDATFFALCSATRRRMLDLLKTEGGCNVSRVCEVFAGEIGRFAVMKHLSTLERGGLLVSQREGRERRLWFNATPMQLIHERWSSEFSVIWAARLTRLKYDAEGAEVRRLPAAPRRADATPTAPPAKRKERRHG